MERATIICNEEVLTLKDRKLLQGRTVEKYSGVEVYMTRTTASLPVSIKASPIAGGCIAARADAAAKAGSENIC